MIDSRPPKKSDDLNKPKKNATLYKPIIFQPYKKPSFKNMFRSKK